VNPADIAGHTPPKHAAIDARAATKRQPSRPCALARAAPASRAAGATSAPTGAGASRAQPDGVG